MNKIILVTASVFGLLAIVLGAFASHGLKELISAESLQTFETGVRYQMYHVIVMLALGLSTGILPKTQKWVFWFFIIGILFLNESIGMNAIVALMIILLGIAIAQGKNFSFARF